MQGTKKKSVTLLVNKHISAVNLFLRLFIPLAIIFIFGAIALFRSETDASLSKIHTSETAAIQVGISSIKREIQLISKDLAYLASQEQVLELITNNQPHIHEQIVKDWLAFSKTKGIYDQIRLLNMEGQERIRINFNNGKPTGVAKDKLQNKGKRYYFTDAVKLNKGEFFISPLDLNIEQGKIEQPLKPMIRIGTPVFDHNGNKQGIILLNFLGKTLLDDFHEVADNGHSRAWLLNRDGFWLKGPSTELEWGFMFQQADSSMTHHYKDAWGQIITSVQGQFESDQGLWTYATIYPLIEGQKTSTGAHEAFSPSRSEIESLDYLWKAVSLIPHEDYYNEIWQTAFKLLLATSLLLISLFAGCWHLAQAWIREAKIEDALRQANAGLEETVEQRTKALRHEIVEKKHAEEVLKEREERFRSITTSSSLAAIITVDQKGNIISWNPAAQRSFGYSEEEILGNALITIIPERYRSKHHEGFHRALESNEYHIIGKSIEFYGLHKNGSEFPIEMSLGTWIQSNTRFFSAVIHDITTRKKADDALKEAIAFRNSIFTTLPDLIWLKDPDGVYLSCNPAFERFFGAKENKIIGKSDLSTLFRTQV